MLCKIYTYCVNFYTDCVNSRCFVANLSLFQFTRFCVKSWPQIFRSGKSFDKYHVWQCIKWISRFAKSGRHCRHFSQRAWSALWHQMILGSSFSCIFGLRKFCPLRLLDQDKQTWPFRLFSYIFPVFFVIIVHNSSGLILRAVPICGPNQASGIQRQLIKVKGGRVTRRFAPAYLSLTSFTTDSF